MWVALGMFVAGAAVAAAGDAVKDVVMIFVGTAVLFIGLWRLS